MKSSIKTHEELLYSNKDAFGKSIKEASKLASAETKKALKCLNMSQLGGYASSGILLGLFIPMLNKIVTNKLHEKETEKKKAAISKKTA